LVDTGVTVCVVLLTACLMRMYLGPVDVGVVATIYVSSMIACAGAIAGDNMQDLKTGHVLGATPWRQQIALMFGVVSSAVLMPAVLNLLNSAYGFAQLGSSIDDIDSTLPAPQASLMAFVANGIIHGGLPWIWIAIGAAAALGIIIVDSILSRNNIPFSVPVLAFAVGFYLPLSTGIAILAGSLVGGFDRSNISDDTSDGVLAAGGLITGEVTFSYNKLLLET
jgi:putative OPT family oligopeptide transporter